MIALENYKNNLLSVLDSCSHPPNWDPSWKNVVQQFKQQGNKLASCEFTCELNQLNKLFKGALKCNKCHLLALNPVLQQDNKCYCTECCADLSKIVAGQPLYPILISDFEVKTCTNATISIGDHMVGLAEFYMNNIQQKCPYSNCPTALPMKQLNDHVQVCEFNTFPCPYAQFLKDHPEHLENNPVICTEQVTSQSIEQHFKTTDCDKWLSIITCFTRKQKQNTITVEKPTVNENNTTNMVMVPEAEKPNILKDKSSIILEMDKPITVLEKDNMIIDSVGGIEDEKDYIVVSDDDNKQEKPSLTVQNQNSLFPLQPPIVSVFNPDNTQSKVVNSDSTFNTIDEVTRQLQQFFQDQLFTTSIVDKTYEQIIECFKNYLNNQHPMKFQNLPAASQLRKIFHEKIYDTCYTFEKGKYQLKKPT